MPSTYSHRITEAAVILLAILLLAACGSAPPQRPVAVTTGERMLREARAAHDADHYQRALLRYTDAADHFRSLDNNRGLALALFSQAEILLLLGESRLALAPMSELDSTLDRLGNPADLHARQQLLQARFKAGVSHGSDAARNTVAPLLERKDMIGEAARILDCRELLRMGRGDCAETLAAGSRLGKARVARLRAQAATMRGDIDTALELNDSALATYRDAHYRPGIAATLEERAELMLDFQAGNASSSEESVSKDLLTRALHIRVWLRDRVHAARNVERLATIEPDGGWMALKDQLARDNPSWLTIEEILEILQ